MELICFSEYEDGDLSAWINRERFQNYIPMDGFVLYELGDTGNVHLSNSCHSQSLNLTAEKKLFRRSFITYFVSTMPILLYGNVNDSWPENKLFVIVIRGSSALGKRND